MKMKKAYNILDPEEDSRDKSVHSLSVGWGFFGLIFILGTGLLSRNFLLQLPKPLKNSDQKTYPKSFIAERAWNDLKILNDFGPRPVGSYQNEILALDFLNREISYIKQLAHGSQMIEVDNQKISGAYFYQGHKPFGMTNVYRNVQNVIVKLSGQSNTTLMLNCHFDSVAGSPGASDDAASCCVMLEILRVLSRQTEVRKHTILFLFNGAEETILQAAHGFITNHPWSQNIRAFLNLESVGSGGKEILFQTGPKHPWLLDLYAKSVPYPSAQVAAEEIFQSNLVPSDTDFRIFRDYGKIPGMDFAHFINGYRYHTKYDSIDYIPFEVLQRTGDNILALTKRIADSDELSNTDLFAEGSTVFFDFLGLFFVHYSADFGILLNFFIVLLSIIISFLSLARSTRGTHSKHLRTEAVIGFIASIISIILSGVTCYGIAALLDKMGHSMSWYSRPYLAIGLYCCPALLVNICVHLVCDKLFGNSGTPLSIALKVQARLNGVNLFWGIITLGITIVGYRVGYVTMLLIFFSLISSIIVSICGLQNTVNKWLYVHLVGQFFAILWGTGFYHLLTGMFIPITGRSSGLKNPDIIISGMCCAATLFVCSYMIPLVHLLKNISRLLVTLLTISSISMFLVTSTYMGFPYDDTITAPTVQRQFITHTLRNFYNHNGNLRYTDSGFWLRELDRNAKKTIEGISMPDQPIPQQQNKMCEDEVFCGLPIFSPRQVHVGGYWLPGPDPIVRIKANLKLVKKEKLSSFETKMDFQLTTSALVSLGIRPKEGVVVRKWNILSEVPEPNVFNNKQTYLVMITQGLDIGPMNFTLILKSNLANYDGPLVDLVVTTTHWEYHKEHTPVFNRLLARVPKWAFAVPSVAYLDAYTY